MNQQNNQPIRLPSFKSLMETITQTRLSELQAPTKPLSSYRLPGVLTESSCLFSSTILEKYNTPPISRKASFDTNTSNSTTPETPYEDSDWKVTRVEFKLATPPRDSSEESCEDTAQKNSTKTLKKPITAKKGKQKSKLQRPKKKVREGRCIQCDSTKTPQWRRIPERKNEGAICNSCGLFLKQLRAAHGDEKALIIFDRKKQQSTAHLRGKNFLN